MSGRAAAAAAAHGPLVRLRVTAARRPDWQRRLAHLLAQRALAPFCWGVNDCCLFAADAVLAITDTDPAADLRGTYHTEAQAAEVLRQHGGLVALVIERLGPVVPTAWAQLGDIGITSIEGRRSLAVCGGEHFVAPGAQGLVYVPARQVVRAWRCTAHGTQAGVPHG